jgi:hypothetical protein
MAEEKKAKLLNVAVIQLDDEDEKLGEFLLKNYGIDIKNFPEKTEVQVLGKKSCLTPRWPNR